MSAETAQPHSDLPTVEDARECWNIYIAQIQSTGIVNQFNRDLEGIEKSVIPHHEKNLDELIETSLNLIRMKEILNAFMGISVRMADEASVPRQRKPDVDILELVPRQIALYGIFSGAVEYYAAVFSDKAEGGATLSDITLAATAVHKLVRPGLYDPEVRSHWDDSAPERPPQYYAVPLHDDPVTRRFLETIMHNSGAVITEQTGLQP
jgi:hypothetical protein